MHGNFCHKKKAPLCATRRFLVHILCALCILPGPGLVAWAKSPPVPGVKPELTISGPPVPERKPELVKISTQTEQPEFVEKPLLTKSMIRQDQAITRKAAQALYAGNIEDAYKLAASSLRRSHTAVPLAGWVAGLAAWQRAEYTLAATVFTVTVDSPQIDSWTRSAAAYWAARAHTRAGSPTKTVKEMLERAAAYPDTFYGLLAARALGRDLHAQSAAHILPFKGWMKAEDYRIDPALVHAIIRQESKFDPAARSNKGAQGLMQIMPSTASTVTGRKSNNLSDPMTNLRIGQRYFGQLLEDPSIEGDLLALLAAYNAGPGNLGRWRTDMSNIEDPLLFIELIPIAETRAYIERVMAGYWLYRLRQKLPVPSLEALASGRSARYPATADWQSVNVAMR